MTDAGYGESQGDMMQFWRKILGAYWWLPLLGFYLVEVCHESGHWVAGWLTGANMGHVELWPWQLSATVWAVNPHPGWTVWGGPVVGCLLPLALWLLLRPWRYACFGQWFAGFALIANGIYLAVGYVFMIGDTLTMRQTGTPGWGMLILGLVAFVCGLGLWQGLGKTFAEMAGFRRWHWLSAAVLTAITFYFTVIGTDLIATVLGKALAPDSALGQLYTLTDEQHRKFEVDPRLTSLIWWSLFASAWIFNLTDAWLSVLLVRLCKPKAKRSPWSGEVTGFLIYCVIGAVFWYLMALAIKHYL